MEQVCFALAVAPGKAQAARAFMRELEGTRKAEYAASERRIGIVKEAWFLQAAPMGDLLIGYMESEDFTRSLRMFAESRDPFDIWFKERMGDATGVDLNDPPPGPLSERLSSYAA